MPKQLYKIVQFHGGLNNNADPRDIADNELSESVDIDVSNGGRITMLGGMKPHNAIGQNAVSGFTGTVIEGRGLIAFNHSYIGGEDSGGAGIYPDKMIAVYDDNDQQVWVFSYYAKLVGGTGWDDDITESSGVGTIDIGSTGSAAPTMYFVDGALRVSDGNFGANNTTRWYGVINRGFYGDGTSGLDHNTFNNGLKVTEWWEDNAAPTALAVKGVSTGEHAEIAEADNASPIAVHLEPANVKYQDISSGGTVNSNSDVLKIEVDFVAADNTITSSSDSSVQLLDCHIDNFCSPGDKLIAINCADANNNEVVMTVVSVVGNGTSPNVITVDTLAADHTNDFIQLHNLSRQGWFDSTKQSWNIAVSTLYDDSKQESELKIVDTTLDPGDFLMTADGRGMGALKIKFDVFAGNYNTVSTGIAFNYERVSGFNVYMRRTDGSTTDEPWYLQATVDITKGIKSVGGSEYNMWASADDSEADYSAVCRTEELLRPSSVITYEDSAGIPATATSMGFAGNGTGFKAAVVANRICYVGNVKIYDENGILQVNNSAILKSFVNKFDSFAYNRRIQTTVDDGDEITALEAYADRLLSFKKRKMELINISQEVEFLEDTFMHKGVSTSAAVCKTDFGIAWVNELGCYLYDGQKVLNLLEKGGRRVIDSDIWASFSFTPMIGYVPDKRQIIVVDDAGTDGDGSIYLYDLISQSWTKGSSATMHDQLKTNFVNDWNGKLMYFNGNDNTPHEWDPGADTSTAVDIKTKDIDFGQPGQTKRIYKFYVTHRGSASNIQLSYAKDGDQDTYTEAGSELPVTSAVTDWVTTAITPTTFSCNSVRLRLFSDGTTPANFEINDITIVYRLKGAR